MPMELCGTVCVKGPSYPYCSVAARVTLTQYRATLLKRSGGLGELITELETVSAVFSSCREQCRWSSKIPLQLPMILRGVGH